ncbi:MAG: hypothetical protein A2751_01400 [Candidatus Doudnabacteria bacterium RIFCSPHIGHO2_01_FULL_46_14]|uniref:Putative gluconeogenesis factor n=1 Tax=Candidatus Doudnabacteria bacterium RIFCSPHIGHO2_01_FULL_46_14 TaxID=1817824 RepID=A0A1F5NMA5_9BACT|nr:MAG: hypothetical protein A2751_01400 [Candidatus Doudnabacteria bacterium RIFCSPHIGHO2_01_FULL_46_14]
MKNIVIIGGGTGTFTLLSGLRQFPTNNSVIVSTADDGGSTGKLREELNVIPPGDIRQCLVGLSYTDEEVRNLFSYRFAKGSLAGHTVGNIIITALEKSTGSIEKAIVTAAKMLNVRGEVVPVTLYPTTLTAVLANGKRIVGEHNIDELPASQQRAQIKSLDLTPKKSANPRAIRLINDAHAIVFGPGDLFTSIIPNLLVKGMKEAIKKSKAQKIYVANIMTKHGQTDDFKCSDCAGALQKYLGAKLDYVVVNTAKPDAKTVREYAKEKAAVMVPDMEALKKQSIKVAAENLISKKPVVKVPGDSLRRSLARHDSEKLARIIYDILND